MAPITVRRIIGHTNLLCAAKAIAVAAIASVVAATATIATVRRMRILAILMCAALAIAAAAIATAADISALIEKLPADTAGERGAIFRDLVASGQEGVAELAQMLRDPEEGGDTKARYALHGMALHVARPGAQVERAAFAATLASRFGKTASAETDRFLVRQMLYAGGAESVEALGKLLLDGELGESAAAAMVAIGPASLAALREALPRAEGRNRMAIIRALGDLKDENSLKALSFAVTDSDLDVRTSALSALGQSGDSAALEVIMGAAESATGYEHDKAWAALLRLADRLREEGRPGEAARLFRQIWDEALTPEEVHLRCAALRGLAAVNGTRAMPQVAAVQLGEDAQLAAAALEIAGEAEGTGLTEWWIGRAGSEIEPGARAAALKVLARRGDAAALPAIRKGLKDGSLAVRVAAIDAAGNLGGSSLATALAGALDSEEEDEASAAREALLKLPGRAASRAMSNALAQGGPKSRAVLVEILGRRLATEQLPAVMGRAGDADEKVRVEALKAVGLLGEEGDLPFLAKRILTAEEKERSASRDSYVQICQRQTDFTKCVDVVIAALEDASPAARAALLSILPVPGGGRALQAARNGLSHGDGEVVDAAVRALSEWPSPEPADDLLKVARSDADIKRRVLALRGYVRLTGLDSDRPGEETVRMYAQALEAAPRPEDRKQVFSALGRVRHGDALRLALANLRDEAAGDEAAAAAIRIARRRQGQNLDEAMEALKLVKGKARSKEMKVKAKEALSYLKDHGDYITAWMAAGKFIEGYGDRDEIIDTVFDPEKPDADVDWRRVWIDYDNDYPWRIDLNDLFYGENCAGYLRTWVKAPKEMRVRLEIGSDDGVKAWLNGEMVHRAAEWRGLEDGQDKVPALLREGWNELMLKIVQGGGDWSVSCRIRSKSGKRLRGIRISGQKPG